MKISQSLASIALCLVSGCAAKGEFPSLSPRAIELGLTAPTPTAPPTPSDSARVARFQASLAKAESGASAFDAALAKARQAVAGSDGTRGSERWIAAQMALSLLERTRAPAGEALAEMDQEQRLLLQAPPSADKAPFEAAWARVTAINSAQQDAVRALLDQVSR